MRKYLLAALIPLAVPSSAAAASLSLKAARHAAARIERAELRTWQGYPTYVKGGPLRCWKLSARHARCRYTIHVRAGSQQEDPYAPPVSTRCRRSVDVRRVRGRLVARKLGSDCQKVEE